MPDDLLGFLGGGGCVQRGALTRRARYALPDLLGKRQHCLERFVTAGGTLWKTLEQLPNAHPF